MVDTSDGSEAEQEDKDAWALVWEAGRDTMKAIIGSGGGRYWATKAARQMLSGYLNASCGLNYYFEPDAIVGIWDDCVAEYLSSGEVDCF